MKYRFRRVLGAFLALSLSLILNSAAYAAPRKDRDASVWPEKVIRIIQKYFGISTQEHQPVPPKP